ncbi:sulfur relay protein DsrH [Marinitoga sp. 1135]|uniref:Sulfur relay protein TusB/DsrH n=2 Tax=Marinitoga TaxID=160798 RepID=H2J2N9_MARPK|nr:MULTISPECIES: sulfurtransferase complex subunit TusB [Marinitoga]AEX84483.1 sulfur relay protein TusB/DsrH [Marinitoga piezophila KA3]APT74981.1 sulfur relay protein DsrH [Marinitoga sp. 1137]NUU94737.1 sulfur relay protein DsrH [Marinitoga sp. 1135]NUU96666.1 sulfur relay protein DsrH [Marinitoga sp. 1138]
MALIMVKYGIDHPVERLKIQSAKNDDTIVLIQNGIYWNFENLKKLTDAEVVLLKEDFNARGYSDEDANVKLVDYNGLIEVIEKQEKFIG